MAVVIAGSPGARVGTGGAGARVVQADNSRTSSAIGVSRRCVKIGQVGKVALRGRGWGYYTTFLDKRSYVRSLQTETQGRKTFLPCVLHGII